MGSLVLPHNCIGVVRGSILVWHNRMARDNKVRSFQKKKAIIMNSAYSHYKEMMFRKIAMKHYLNVIYNMNLMKHPITLLILCSTCHLKLIFIFTH